MGPSSPGAALREIFQRPETVVVPFGSLPIHAQMAQHAGFEAFELSGGMSAWWAEGASDVGWLTLTEVVAHAKRVARSTDIPVYCDADTGFGAPINVQRTVAEFIDAGVAGIHIEDQREPKKSGGTTGIELVSDAEAIGRLNAAVDARDRLDADFVIVARTDGFGAAGGSVDEAIRRAQLYRAETGIDVIFFEGFHTWEQAELALKETPGSNYVMGADLIGRRPLHELTAVGQSIEAVPFVLPGVHEVWRLLLDIKEAGDATPFAAYVEKMNEAKGTAYDFGWGARLGRPSPEYVQSTEEKYLPPEAQRDYVNTPNA
ncbi:isocitrate lyase/PEP mutase family protein [Nocardia sp. NPDC019395]|uniref:isocitrate lyase/PEP mutase family protein n=1 Tax=Nocardia sp. NPDC019395 TaxID=3154686 RepID=UPI00340B9600